MNTACRVNHDLNEWLHKKEELEMQELSPKDMKVFRQECMQEIEQEKELFFQAIDGALIDIKNNPCNLVLIMRDYLAKDYASIGDGFAKILKENLETLRDKIVKERLS